MKITEQDLTFFKNLAQTETGRYLADFCKKVMDHAYDSRSWADGDSKESAAHAARLIQAELVDRIKPRVKDQKTDVSFE